MGRMRWHDVFLMCVFVCVFVIVGNPTLRPWRQESCARTSAGVRCAWREHKLLASTWTTLSTVTSVPWAFISFWSTYDFSSYKIRVITHTDTHTQVHSQTGWCYFSSFTRGMDRSKGKRTRETEARHSASPLLVRTRRKNDKIYITSWSPFPPPPPLLNTEHSN